MLENLSKTALSGCVAFAGIGVLVTPFHKKTGICMILGGLASATLIYKFWYQPEQIKAQINKVAQDLGYEDDISLRSPRDFPLRQAEGMLAFRGPALQTHRSSSWEYSDGANTDGDFTDDERDEHFKDIDLSDEGDDNPMPRAEPSSPSVKLKPGLANYILSWVGLGQREKEKAI